MGVTLERPGAKPVMACEPRIGVPIVLQALSLGVVRRWRTAGNPPDGRQGSLSASAILFEPGEVAEWLKAAPC